MDNLCIIVTTCDKYSDLWINNINLFDKYWETHPKIYLISDKESNLMNNANCCFRNFSGDFSLRLLKALKEIDSEYVFLTLDDYLLCNFVDAKRIEVIIDEMDKKRISYIRFFKRMKTKGWLSKDKKIHLLPLTSEAYEVNLYPSIWRKTDLINLISKEENIWKFEVRMTRRCRENKLLCGWTDNKNCFDFVDTIRKGKYLRKAYRFLKKEKLYISDRSIRTMSETIKLNLRTIISRYSPKILKNKLKKITKGEYYSNFANDDD